MARLDSVLSFSRGDPEDEAAAADQPEAGAAVTVASYDTGSSDDDDDDAGFEFAFAPPLVQEEDAVRLAPADDLFAHGRILPAYPVFERRQNDGDDTREDAVAPHQQTMTQAAASTSPDTYCAWAPRSAPGSPARERDSPVKSASTGEARSSFLRGLVRGGSGRSHSDGKEKFVFLQQQEQQRQKQSKTKQGKPAVVTEMDMATAHRLFYGKKKQGGALPGAADRKQHSSYLPYRTGIVGFFATAHALGRSHHPY